MGIKVKNSVSSNCKIKLKKIYGKEWNWHEQEKNYDLIMLDKTVWSEIFWNFQFDLQRANIENFYEKDSI